MQSNRRTDAEAPSGEDLAALFDELKAADRALQRAVRHAGELAGSGVCERVEGGPLEWAIGMLCRMTGTDRRMIVAAGETLRHLPTVDQLWADALVSWGQIRSIVLAVRRLPVAKRRELDARIAATIVEYGGIDAFDPDHLVEAVDAAAAEMADPRSAERREARQRATNFLSLQLSLDGRVRGYFDYDPVSGAIVTNGLDAASERPAATDDPQPGEPTTRGKQYAEGLVEMAAEYLGGANSATAGPDGKRRRRRRARPLLVAHTQVGDVTRGHGGILELNLRGRSRASARPCWRSLPATPTSGPFFSTARGRSRCRASCGPTRFPTTFASRSWLATWATGSPGRKTPLATSTSTTSATARTAG